MLQSCMDFYFYVRTGSVKCIWLPTFWEPVQLLEEPSPGLLLVHRKWWLDLDQSLLSYGTLVSENLTSCSHKCNKKTAVVAIFYTWLLPQPFSVVICTLGGQIFMWRLQKKICEEYAVRAFPSGSLEEDATLFGVSSIYGSEGYKYCLSQQGIATILFLFQL